MIEPDPIVERLAATAKETVEKVGDITRTASQPTGAASAASPPQGT